MVAQVHSRTQTSGRLDKDVLSRISTYWKFRVEKASIIVRSDQYNDAGSASSNASRLYLPGNEGDGADFAQHGVDVERQGPSGPRG